MGTFCSADTIDTIEGPHSESERTWWFLRSTVQERSVSESICFTRPCAWTTATLLLRFCPKDTFQIWGTFSRFSSFTYCMSVGLILWLALSFSIHCSIVLERVHLSFLRSAFCLRISKRYTETPFCLCLARPWKLRITDSACAARRLCCMNRNQFRPSIPQRGVRFPRDDTVVPQVTLFEILCSRLCVLCCWGALNPVQFDFWNLSVLFFLT